MKINLLYNIRRSIIKSIIEQKKSEYFDDLIDDFDVNEWFDYFIKSLNIDLPIGVLDKSNEHKNKPTIKILDDGTELCHDYSKLSLENCSILDIVDNKITFSAGGDWQYPQIVSIIMDNGYKLKVEGYGFEESNKFYPNESFFNTIFETNDYNKIVNFFGDYDEDDSELIKKVRNSQNLSEDEIEELNKKLSDKLKIKGKKTKVKIDNNGKRLAFLKHNELKKVIEDEIENDYYIVYNEKDSEELKELRGKKIKSSNLNDEIIFWLDSNPSIPFSIKLNDDDENISFYEDELYDTIYSVYKTENTTLLKIDEEVIENKDLRSDEEFQKFINKIKVYDGDRFLVDNMILDYNEEELDFFLNKLFDVGYLKSSHNYKNTGNKFTDKYYVLTSKFIRMKKIVKLRSKLN
jgi:hypothetical protein